MVALVGTRRSLGMRVSLFSLLHLQSLIAFKTLDVSETSQTFAKLNVAQHILLIQQPLFRIL